MYTIPLQIGGTLTDMLLGLAVAASAAFIYGRTKSGAGFLGLAGAAYILGTIIHLALGPMYAHFAVNLVSLFGTFVSAGKNLVFYGGLALAIRAIATPSPSAPAQHMWPQQPPRPF